MLRRAQPPAPIVLTGWAALAACALCALPVLLGFVLPAATSRMKRAAAAGFDPDLVRPTLNTDPARRRRDRVALALGFGAVIAARLIRGRGPTAR